ncbi:Mut7-C RNAse domain-containing protein [Saccharopolyspora cebuensis]|uniref:Mut7-C RNAse domain-containing protein n=1 Tax=Saccharopolyspora cebuensis TaxID=418759 RepID=UPI0031EF654F
MADRAVRVLIAPELRFFLPRRYRGGQAAVRHDPTATIGHVVESLGVPLPEVGALLLDGAAAAPGARAAAGSSVEVRPVRRPQPVPARFLLDVHFGALARRMRLLGLDASYRNDATDDELAERAHREDRVLLTQDRGLLRRRAVTTGAYVRGRTTDEQLADVLDRFRPALAPWTRCAACGGPLEPVAKQEVAHRLQPGTLREHDEFARCRDCGQVYWRGAHSRRIEEMIRRARGGGPPGGAAPGG